MKKHMATATELQRKPAKTVSYNNTKLRPRSEGGNGKLGTIADRPKVK